MKILTTVGEAMPLEVERDGKTLSMALTPRAEGPDRVGDAGLVPLCAWSHRQGRTGASGGPSRAFARGPDRRALTGETVLYWPRVAYLLQSGKGKPVQLSILRGGREFSTTLTPVLTDVMGEKRWRIGVTFHNDMVGEETALGKAVAAAVQDNCGIVCGLSTCWARF